eukprot:6469606-Amphidinium_carterae.2
MQLEVLTSKCPRGGSPLLATEDIAHEADWSGNQDRVAFHCGPLRRPRVAEGDGTSTFSTHFHVKTRALIKRIKSLCLGLSWT